MGQGVYWGNWGIVGTDKPLALRSSCQHQVAGDKAHAEGANQHENVLRVYARMTRILSLIRAIHSVKGMEGL